MRRRAKKRKTGNKLSRLKDGLDRKVDVYGPPSDSSKVVPDDEDPRPGGEALQDRVGDVQDIE